MHPATVTISHGWLEARISPFRPTLSSAWSNPSYWHEVSFGKTVCIKEGPEPVWL